MQNILDHVKCGIFALTIESIPPPTSVDETSLTAKFAIANLEFQRLLFGETQNQQTINLLGLEPEQCLPSDFAQLLHTHIHKCWQTKVGVEFETTMNGGSHSLLSVSLSPEFGDDHNLRQIVGTCQHIGEKALSKSQLKDFNHKKFSQLISEVSDAFVVIDHEGVVRYINQSAEELFGCSSEEIVGETFGLPVVDGQSTDVDILNRGSTTSAEMRVSHAVDADRRVYVVASLRDVSERKRVEESNARN